MADHNISEVHEPGDSVSQEFINVVRLFMGMYARGTGEGLYRVFNELSSNIELAKVEFPVDEANGQYYIFLEELIKFRLKERDTCIAFLGDIWIAIEKLNISDYMTWFIEWNTHEIASILARRALERTTSLVEAYKLAGYSGTESYTKGFEPAATRLFGEITTVPTYNANR